MQSTIDRISCPPSCASLVATYLQFSVAEKYRIIRRLLWFHFHPALQGRFARSGAPRAGFFGASSRQSLPQGFGRVIGEEVLNVGIVFKLPVDRRWMRLFLFQNLVIRLNRVAAGLSGVGAQPFLKRHAEGKAPPDFLRRKRPVRFGAHLVRLDDRLPGDRSAAGRALFASSAVARPFRYRENPRRAR